MDSFTRKTLTYGGVAVFFVLMAAVACGAL